MKGQVRASLFGIAGVALLVACASKSAVDSPGPTTAGASAEDKLAAEYQSVIDNASQHMVCRRQPVTGSRLQTREVCLTAADLEAQRDDARRLMGEVRPRTDNIPQSMPEPSTSVPRTTP